MSGWQQDAALAVHLVRTPPVPTETVLDGQLCLYAPAAVELLVLNESAGAIWAATAPGPLRAGDLLGSVAEQFGVPATDIIDDVLRTLERFLAAGLLGVVTE